MKKMKVHTFEIFHCLISKILQTTCTGKALNLVKSLANQASKGLNHSSSCKVHQPWATAWDHFCRMDESKAKIKDANQDQAVDVHSAHSANYFNKRVYANLVCSKCQFFGLHNQHMDFRHILLNKSGNWITTSQNALGLPENSHSTTIMLLFETKWVKDKKKSTD